jgi:hypothetical protein
LKPLKFAFIASNKVPAKMLADPSFIYRCENVALALQQQGHQVKLLHIRDLSWRDQFDVVVLHRPRPHFWPNILLKRLARNGTKIIADFDDLVFDPQWVEVSPGVLNGVASAKQVGEVFRGHAEMLELCHGFTVSVAPLRDKMQSLMPDRPVALLFNSVHINWLNIAPAPDRLSQKRLTYFPGTRSHDRDFATILPALQEFLHEEPQVQLCITGVLNAQVRCRANQLVRNEKQPFVRYAGHVAQSWINLAPLENTLFNQHKSGLKAIEASYFNAPTLATPIPDMQRLSAAGAVLVDAPEQWFSSLKTFCDWEYYVDYSKNLRQRILELADAQQQAKRLVAFSATL